VLAPAVEQANEQLEQAGEVPLPERLTPHKLRYTYASLLAALGVDPGSVMDKLERTDPRSRCGCADPGCAGTTGQGERCASSSGWTGSRPIGQQRAAARFLHR
jgi:hypothetical protein